MFKRDSMKQEKNGRIQTCIESVKEQNLDDRNRKWGINFRKSHREFPLWLSGNKPD